MDQEEQDLGKLLDAAMDQLGVRLPPSFDPRTYAVRKAPIRHWYAWRAGAAAVILLMAGAASQGLWSTSVDSPAPSSHPHIALPVIHSPAAAEEIPVWTETAQAPWQVVVNVHPLAALHASEVVSAGPPGRSALAVGYRGGRPVWIERGATSEQSLSTPAAQYLAGRWHLGGPTGLTSLAAAGSYTYVTEGARWAVMDAPVSADWRSEPDPLASWSWIQALPNSPATAVLWTSDTDGEQGLFWRSSLVGSWKPEALPGSPITELVAAGSRFWALAGGRLVVSSNGRTWTDLYSPPPGFAVTTFAIDPVGSGEITLALTPDTRAGIGPILLSRNNGATWTTLPTAWPTSGGAVSLVLDGAGDVTALFGAPGPIVVQRYNRADNQWTILPLPAGANVRTAGQLAALSQGDLVYADASGRLYVWTLPRGIWREIPAPAGSKGSASLVMGIGTQQVLTAYGNQWAIYVTS